jgi:hypothetical protein
LQEKIKLDVIRTADQANKAGCGIGCLASSHSSSSFLLSIIMTVQLLAGPPASSSGKGSCHNVWHLLCVLNGLLVVLLLLLWADC